MDTTADSFEDSELEGKSEEELSIKAENSKDAMISLPEKILTVSASGLADLAEFLGLLAVPIPVIGPVIFGLCYIFGIIVSGGLFFWSSLRGIKGSFFIKRLVIMAVGFLADEGTGGGLPIRTITLILVIYFNNRFEKATQDKIMSGLGKGLKILEKVV